LETLKKLNEHTCRSYGGNNCVLHQCMFYCVLWKAKQEAAKREGVEEKDILQPKKN